MLICLGGYVRPVRRGKFEGVVYMKFDDSCRLAGAIERKKVACFVFLQNVLNFLEWCTMVRVRFVMQSIY